MGLRNGTMVHQILAVAVSNKKSKITHIYVLFVLTFFEKAWLQTQGSEVQL